MNRPTASVAAPRRRCRWFSPAEPGPALHLKDFRTLLASLSVLEALAHTKPAPRERQRRKQVREAVQAAADDPANTVAICRKSYVHDTVVAAFEDGCARTLLEESQELSFADSPGQDPGEDHHG